MESDSNHCHIFTVHETGPPVAKKKTKGKGKPRWKASVREAVIQVGCGFFLRQEKEQCRDTQSENRNQHFFCQVSSSVDGIVIVYYLRDLRAHFLPP